MHNYFVYARLLMKKFLKQHYVLQTEINIQTFSDRKAELLATGFSMYQ